MDHATVEHGNTISRILNAGDIMLKLMGLSAYVDAKLVAENQRVLVSQAGWLNHPLAEAADKIWGSKAPVTAAQKTASLVAFGSMKLNDIVTTPLFKEDSSGKGAVRYFKWAVGVAGSVGCNDEDTETLIATILAHALHENRLRIHHVGFRYPTAEEYKNAVLKRKMQWGEKNVYSRPADDHLRHYTYIGENPSGDPLFIEDQYFPDDLQDQRPGIHIDLITRDPEGVLNRFGGILNKKPIFWENNQPAGCLWASQLSNVPIGLMTRSNEKIWDPRQV